MLGFVHNLLITMEDRMLPGFVEYVNTNVPGYVYLLYLKQELIYIGSTIHLRNRIREHSRSFQFGHIWYKVFDTIDEARQVEADLIYKLQPSRNISGKGEQDPFIKGFGSINLLELGIDVTKFQ